MTHFDLDKEISELESKLPDSESAIAPKEDKSEGLRYSPIPEDKVATFYEFKGITRIIEALKSKGYQVTLEDEKKIFDYVLANPMTEGMIPDIYFEDLVSALNLKKDYQSRALIKELNKMGNLPVITSGVKALRDRKWGKDDLGKACYVHKKADNSDSYITHYIRDFNDSEEIASLPHSEAIQILEKFGVYPALLHLILAVHFYKQPDPTTAILMLRGTDLIKDLGLDKRKDLTKEQKLARVYETITAVRSLLIKAKWTVNLRGRKKPVNVSFDPYVMWDILPLKITDTDLFGNETLIEIEVKVRAGLWLDEFLSKVGKGSSKVFYSYATLSQKILDLDPYHEELALRIALLQSTMDYRQYYTVEQWLIENLLGAKPKISEAKTDRIKRKKLVDLWDNTLKSLERIGFKIHFDNKTYPEEFRPDFEGKKPRGYFERLLEAKIKLTPESLGKPESDQDAIEAEKIPITPEKVYRGEDLKKARLKANVSPIQIAKYLDCSKGKIYNAEKRDNLSEKLFKEIISAVRYISKNPTKYPKT
ncbi:hypothetical protein [Cyanobacterium aponinum]|uniref:hypothetical protein n=1 Tax=Cyanobacterium aponinum TaxID=379064 RepID=UPI000C12B525|nr:hypothetical protein [Cyanobacterium aponinum]PHV60990.1 hypothetical protein CSQ80_17980 [Cyanobacterium aponinum IPPAS B-1201]